MKNYSVYEWILYFAWFQKKVLKYCNIAILSWILKVLQNAILQYFFNQVLQKVLQYILKVLTEGLDQDFSFCPYITSGQINFKKISIEKCGRSALLACCLQKLLLCLRFYKCVPHVSIKIFLKSVWLEVMYGQKPKSCS